MKNNKHILILLLLIAVICFSLFSCVAENNVSQAVSQPETSAILKEQILVLGDFKPKEEQIVTYEKALEIYRDEFLASVAASTAQEAFATPNFSENISHIRIYCRISKYIYI